MHTAIAALTLAAVLGRAAAYVATFERQLSAIVAEEHYVQTVARQAMLPSRTELRSDLLLVHARNASDWAEYRDVIDVDGQPVRDRVGPPSGVTDLQAIVEASARHNIGDIVRTFNTPLFALRFLEPANQSRFAFKKGKNATPVTVSAEAVTPGAFRTSTEVWVIEYKERSHPTMVRTPERKDVPSHGRFWIEPETGRVLMSEVISENRHVRATIDVSYQSEPLMGVLVPIEMREWYDGGPGKTHIEAVATYGRFRTAKE
jgi:hypothetical protein